METNYCDHICSGNCRREGCNCECGEFHNEDGIPKCPDCEGTGEVSDGVDNIMPCHCVLIAKAENDVDSQIMQALDK